MIITSHHARVFDGITQARMRAVVESRLPEGQYHETCVFHVEPAVVLWVHAGTGNISPLCQDHMNRSLDGADETGGEPPALIPLTGRRRRT